MSNFKNYKLNVIFMNNMKRYGSRLDFIITFNVKFVNITKIMQKLCISK